MYVFHQSRGYALITRVEIQNYRSIWRSSVNLAPFTMLIGANNSGKSNLLRLLSGSFLFENEQVGINTKHYNHLQEPQQFVLHNQQGQVCTFKNGSIHGVIPELKAVRVFSLNAARAGASEPLIASPAVQEDGSGVVRVLDALKTGDRGDLFERLERTLITYIPEIEKLSFIIHEGQKQLQVREKGLNRPVAVSELSEGTRLVLTILAIVFQENAPAIICLEEIDRGLHPALFAQVIRLCFSLSHEPGGPQIIATGHSPHLLDLFKGHERGVVIAEKANGETTFTTLAEKLGQTEAEPLAELIHPDRPAGDGARFTAPVSREAIPHRSIAPGPAPDAAVRPPVPPGFGVR